MGNGATDPKGGGEPGFGNRDRTGVAGIPDSLYRRMRTNAASSVKDGRYYLQLAGAEARERLLLAAAAALERAGRRADGERQRHHARAERPHDDLRADRRSLPPRTPHPNPETITIKSPDQWTLMGTEQKNLDVPMKVTGKTVYGIDVRVPGMKWAAVKACPVYGGDVKSYDFDAIRTHAGRALRRPVPDSGSGADPRPRLQRRRRRHRRSSGTRPRPRSIGCRSSGTIPPSNAAFNTANMREALLAALDQPGQRARQSGRRRRRASRAPRRSSRRPTRRRICRARAWSPATPPCSSPTIASTSGSAIRARRKRASAPRRSRASPSRTSICTCAISAAASAATATVRRPSRRS